MLRIAIALAIALAAAAAPAGARTLGQSQIVSEAALAKLKGNKGVTLQWLWNARPGKFTVTETPDGLMATGQQGPHNGDELAMNGVITRIEGRTFWFKGRIVITDNETSAPCVRDGTYTFRIIGARRFWRMKENAANCAGRADLADYVDIRF